MRRAAGLLALSSWLLVGPVAAWQSAPLPAKSDLERLQGRWEGRGPGGPCTIVIEGSTLIYTQPHTDTTQPQFRYKTSFTLPEATGPKQIHATILEYSFDNPQDIGTVVVTIYEVDDETLRLGVVEDFKELPEEPIVGDWEWVMDLYELERSQPPLGGV